MSLLAVLVVLVVILPTVVLAAYVLIALARHARRRRRAPHLRTLTDREVKANGRPTVDPLLITPLRAPRNGTTYDPVE